MTQDIHYYRRKELLMNYCNGRIANCYVTFQRRQWHPTPILLSGKSHGQRSLVGCSPCGHEELDMTEQLHFHFSLLCIGEENGNPLKCSCLENPRDGVTQRWTRLKRLSSNMLPLWLNRANIKILSFAYNLACNCVSAQFCSKKV